jgi:hypothetical protein
VKSREMTAEEADDHWTEHGDLTPAEVWTREQEDREERAARPCKCGCPSCPQVPHG